MSEHFEQVSLGVSSCLVGEKVRYDGDDRRDDFLVTELGNHVDWVKFCPEVEAGLGVPRSPIQLVYVKGKVRAQVIADPELDHTRELKQLLSDHLHLFEPLSGFVLKARSPSCGKDSAPIFKNGVEKGTVSGIFARRLMKTFPVLPVIESESLSDPVRRENFLARVFVLARWKKLEDNGLTPDSLRAFHQRHHHLILSHRSDSARELERMVEKTKKKAIKATAPAYLSLLMQTLRIPPKRKAHVRVLESLADSLHGELDKTDREALKTAIDAFASKRISLEEPMVLLRGFVAELKKHPLRDSAYLHPYPVELALRQPLYPVKDS